MTQSPNSTELAASLGIDPRARRLAEIAAECPIGTGLVSEAEISDFAAALNGVASIKPRPADSTAAGRDAHIMPRPTRADNTSKWPTGSIAACLYMLAAVPRGWTLCRNH